MALRIGSDGQVDLPSLLLAYRSGVKIGNLYNIQSLSYATHLNSPNEISFDVYKLFAGRKEPLWEKLTDFKLLYVPDYDEWFGIYVQIDESETTVKHISGVALYEAELSQLILYDVEINT